MQPTPTRRRLAAGCIGVGVGFMAAALAGPASAGDGGTGPRPYEGNPGCAEGQLEFKISTQLEEGDYQDGDSGVEVELPRGATLMAGFTISIDNVVVDDEEPERSVTFDWAASSDEGPALIDYVLVKSPDGGLEHIYEPPVSSSTHPLSTQDPISHVTFCSGLEVTLTDGGTTTDAGTTDTGDVAPTEVAGAVVEPQALPATGLDDRSLAIIGAALILIGGGTLVYRRRDLFPS